MIVKYLFKAIFSQISQCNLYSLSSAQNVFLLFVFHLHRYEIFELKYLRAWFFLYIIRSTNHDMNLQRKQKSTLSHFDDKRCYESNLESKPWK